MKQFIVGYKWIYKGEALDNDDGGILFRDLINEELTITRISDSRYFFSHRGSDYKEYSYFNLRELEALKPILKIILPLPG